MIVGPFLAELLYTSVIMMKELLDNDTLVAFTSGLQKGFNGVFDAYYDEICYFAWKLSGSREEAEDIAADAFCKLFKIHDRFLTEANIKAFLYITARNNGLKFLKKASTRKTYSTDFATEGIERYISEDIPDEFSLHAIFETGLIKELYKAIQLLPEQSRRILELSYFSGMSTEEIANLLAITPATVRSSKRYALNELRKKFTNNQMAISLIFALALLENVSCLDHRQLFI